VNEVFPLDYLGRPLNVGDFVFYFGNLYIIQGKSQNIDLKGNCSLKIMLVDKSKTTKPVSKRSREMCKVDRDDVLAWRLKENK